MDLKSLDLGRLSVDDLSALYDEVARVLAEKIEQERSKLEDQLAKIRPSGYASASKVVPKGTRKVARRPYPPVRPKFRNPSNPSETWAGRGKQPRWLVSQLKAGKKIEDFLIARKGRARAPA